MKQLSLVLIFAIFCQSALSQIPQDARLREIRRDLESKVKKAELASIAIAVIKKDKTIWKEVLGWADRERKIKAHSNTIYPLASLSKSITATGLWILAEQGKLSVNDPVEKHLRSARLTYYQGSKKELKIKHLLNMEGGIPHQYEYFYDKDQEVRPSLKEQIGRYGFVAFPPGKVHNYSNFSMGILDQVIADVSGRKFEEFIKEEVFKPLGMKRSFAERPENEMVAKGYDPEGKPVSPNIF
ncbi:MAG: beta-lactamase family protein, partial [Acidobacteria bacterium]|nr:beta-lactamase family protein [Acidobacteriota bacterium]